MKHRAMVVLLVLGAAVVGFMSVGWVRAADSGPELGRPVVVTPSPDSPPTPSRTDPPVSGSSGESTASTPDKSTPQKSTADKPTPRKSKAEPVKPPSPRPGGDGDDDDDDDGGDDDDD
ncbi:hypothetical protein [Nonomuraea sp. SYSU D8015]|uniref:hypothetical protein n=1 Tax=Nonomuraea sp. SYSU D8015 TaxID=2593644 RepID=UPI001660F316|nr:hypothetical protein [Nonomuraea sp. SYSU D8015]